MNAEEIQNKLTDLAFERTTPFCYSCYQDCPDGQCKICGSDDLMRHLKGVGVEYGTEPFRHRIWRTIRGLKKRSYTIIFTGSIKVVIL